MITTPKWIGLLTIAFVAGSFIASPEFRAYAANAVFSADIVDGEVKTADLGSNAVTAAKVKDGEIKAAEIATDAVGAAELQGVTKLLYGQCSTSDAVGQLALEGGFVVARCTINGADTDDSVIATMNGQGNPCFDAGRAYVESSNVIVVWIRDDCETTDPIKFASGNSLALLVYDK